MPESITILADFARCRICVLSPSMQIEIQSIMTSTCRDFDLPYISNQLYGSGYEYFAVEAALPYWPTRPVAAPINLRTGDEFDGLIAKMERAAFSIRAAGGVAVIEAMKSLFRADEGCNANTKKGYSLIVARWNDGEDLVALKIQRAFDVPGWDHWDLNNYGNLFEVSWISDRSLAPTVLQDWLPSAKNARKIFLSEIVGVALLNGFQGWDFSPAIYGENEHNILHIAEAIASGEHNGPRSAYFKKGQE